MLALVAKIDASARLRRRWQLEGGISRGMSALEVERSGRAERWVVRTHERPADAAREHALLVALHARGVPAPRPLALDGDVVVLAWVEGRSGVEDPAGVDVIELARGLAAIHGLGAAELGDAARGLPRLEGCPELRSPAAAAGPNGLGQRAADLLETLRALGPPQGQGACLLHGDYWLGNTLWRDGRLVAVIDWEDAAIGAPLADLARARSELAWILGQSAAERLAAGYERSTGVAIDAAALAWWDLAAALRIGRIALHAEVDTATVVAATHTFVDAALERV